MIDVRLAIPAAVAWAGLVVVLPAPGVLPGVAAAAGAVGVAAVGVAAGLSWRASVSRHVTGSGARFGRGESGLFAAGLVAAGLALVALAAVTTSAALRTDERRPSVAVTAAERASTVVLGGVATQPVSSSGNLTLRATSLTVRSSVSTVRMPVFVVRASFSASSPRPGDSLTVKGRLVEASPGDQVSFVFHPSGDATVTPGGPGPAAWAADLREGFARLTEVLPGDGGALLPGLSIGDTSRVDERLDSSIDSP